MSDLRGKTAILTGAAQGLGYAIARAYAAEGMRVALMDVQRERLNQVADEVRALGGEALPIAVDLSDAAATQIAADEALAVLGTPCVLVHNAALLREVPFAEVRFENWRRELDIILQAAFLLCKAVWQPMMAAGGGSIVLLSSGSGIKGFVNESAYCPGKHGQEGLMKVLSMEGAPHHIAVNTITPGAPINTPMSDSNYSPEMKLKWVDPALLAPAFVYLAKQGAAGLTGERLSAWDVSEQIRAGQITL
jgi:NAD(P)-dependent dehydrogenase (short-subunit alcohol dehydrogenase family)